VLNEFDEEEGKFDGLKEVATDLSTKFSDVKGVDEAKADLEEIVHYLRDSKVSDIAINLHAGVSVRHSFLDNDLLN
jgi:hypothetical protein